MSGAITIQENNDEVKVMKYVTFDETRPLDLILLGRVAIDFNPAYNDQVKEEFKPLKEYICLKSMWAVLRQILP